MSYIYPVHVIVMNYMRRKTMKMICGIYHSGNVAIKSTFLGNID